MKFLYCLYYLTLKLSTVMNVAFINHYGTDTFWCVICVRQNYTYFVHSYLAEHGNTLLQSRSMKTS